MESYQVINELANTDKVFIWVSIHEDTNGVWLPIDHKTAADLLRLYFSGNIKAVWNDRNELYLG